jgi:glycosyltransferase involved in cell wall biosynthesis
VEWRIIDNGSTDGTADWLLKMAAWYPGRVHVTLHADNTGVAGGRQLLLDQARGNTMIFLDSDVEARRNDWLDKLLACLNIPDVGLAGPGGHWITKNWDWYEPVTPGYVGEVDTVSGYCQAFTRKAINGFNMDMFFSPFWHEDTDLTLWLKDKGYSTWCTGDIGLFHIFAGTGDRGGGKAKQAYLASKWRGKGLVRFEREADELKNTHQKVREQETAIAPAEYFAIG